MSTNEALREILRIYPRACGTVYVTHYAMGCTHKEMVHTQVLFVDAPGVTAQVEQRVNTPFAMRCTFTSTATLPAQGQAGSTAEGDFPRAAGSLINES